MSGLWKILGKTRKWGGGYCSSVISWAAFGRCPLVSREGGGEFGYFKNKFKNIRRIGHTALRSEHVAIFAFTLTVFSYFWQKTKTRKTNQHAEVDVCRVGRLRQLCEPSSCSMTHKSLAQSSMCDLDKQLLGVGGGQLARKGTETSVALGAPLRARRHILWTVR